MIHPDTTNSNDVNMDLVLDAVSSFNCKALIFYPNVDANNSEIVSSISRYKSNQNFYMIRHMPLEGFIHALSHCSCMISNSSSGIREAASFGIPVVNIGFRQDLTVSVILMYLTLAMTMINYIIRFHKFLVSAMINAIFTSSRIVL